MHLNHMLTTAHDVHNYIDIIATTNYFVESERAAAVASTSKVNPYVSPDAETSFTVEPSATESLAYAQNSAKTIPYVVAEEIQWREQRIGVERSHSTNRDDHDDDDDDARAVWSCATQPGVVEQVASDCEPEASSVDDEHVNSANGDESTENVSTPTKYTSFVIITQESREPLAIAATDETMTATASTAAAQVSIVPSDTTHIVSETDTDDECDDSITVRHTNSLSSDEYESNSLAGYFDSLISSGPSTKRHPIVTNHVNSNDDILPNDIDHFYYGSSTGRPTTASVKSDSSDNTNRSTSDDVTVVTENTLSALCVDDEIPDDWIDEEESDVESAEELQLCTMGGMDREEELRGYNRASIDFTLHTIVEESCEESEVETNDISYRKNRVSASELEKYFFFGLGNANGSDNSNVRDDLSASETSSLYSDGMDSIGGGNGANTNGVECADNTIDLASSRLEKYFLTTFMGYSNDRKGDSDGSSGSVGSDSEGHASPEQRRKRLVRARGTPRSHNSSLDNLLAAKDDSMHDSIEHSNANDSNQNTSSETDTCDETVIHLDKLADSSNDTLKRKKNGTKKRGSGDSSEENRKSFGLSDDELNASAVKMPFTEYVAPSTSANVVEQKQLRDSGFIGSNDDLLKGEDALRKSPTSTLKTDLEEIKEADDIREQSTSTAHLQQQQQQQSQQMPSNSLPPSSTLTRKDSFNNWSSDEETNLMMSRMRHFFKTLVASQRNASKSSTPTHLSGNTTPVKANTPVARPRLSKSKPSQLVFFENALTELMKTVPGIDDNQVREIVEYLSSEETWSDSYDSSDYTSSDLESATAVSASKTNKSHLQAEISASCQQIIQNFEADEEGDMGDGGVFVDDGKGFHRETALVYQKLMASFSKLSAPSSSDEKPPQQQLQQQPSASKSTVATASTSRSSPPMIANIMNHIGTRLVALMHEVSSGESHAGGYSPKPAARYHKKLQQKISATTTDEDDDDDMHSTEAYNLPRSKSHDILGEGDVAEYDRVSWRGSFESALLANSDSRTKLTLLDRDSTSAIALATKRRSAGDLLFNQKSFSREQLDRVRSCGSIGNERDDIDSTDEEDAANKNRHLGTRSTLPRSLNSLQTTSASSTNSLPRLSQSQKSQSASCQFVPNSSSAFSVTSNSVVKSARYRAPVKSPMTTNTTAATTTTTVNASNGSPVVTASAAATAATAISATTKKVVSPLGSTSLYTKRDSRMRIRSMHNGKSHRILFNAIESTEFTFFFLVTSHD